MKQGITIQYDTVKFNEQYPIICASRMKARQKVINDAYVDTTGLSRDDPQELWRFANGNSELIEPLTEKEKAKAKVIADRLRQLDPQFPVTPETYDMHKTELGTPTLRETVQSLANRIKDDAVLTKHLTTLLKIYKRGPLTKADYNDNRADSVKTTRLLIDNWIQEPLGEKWIIASLCFFSDLAMAKFTHLMVKKTPLPRPFPTKEKERIAKVYRSLGLIPACQRAIKDIDFKGGKVHWTFFKKRIH